MKNRSRFRTNQVQEIAVPERNCWQKVRSDRVAFLVDGADYFWAFKAAAIRARESITIIGWDVNSRTLLEFPEDAEPDVPNELGRLLDHLASCRDELSIRVLSWDSPLLYAMDREWLPQARFDWFTNPNLCFALDDQHPIGASHHQKIVVIDDSIAFVGGMDLTLQRLDEPGHRPNDPRRCTPDGKVYRPRHDVQIAVDGEAARALANVARDRWKWATGQNLHPSNSGNDCWPDRLPVDLTDVDVAIARTYPAWKTRGEVREIEKLFLDSVARARQTVYIENQYFTAASIAQAIQDRLAEPECPEFVLVLPRESNSWLEQTAMGTKQRYWLSRLKGADRHGRLKPYTPVVGETGEVALDVHSKVMVVDDQLLRIGSANLNNRSMGLDSECDLAIEGKQGSPAAASITNFRNRLLAEHLGTTVERVAAEVDAHGSLIEAIESLRCPDRSLVPLPEASPNGLDRIVAQSTLLDPAKPAEPERIADEFATDETGPAMLRNSLVRLAMLITALVGLAALWRWGPLAQFADAATLEAWSEAVRGGWTSTVVALAAYVVGGLVMFPVIVLIAATGLLFGPITGLIVAGCGSILSAVVGYGIGALVGRDALHRISGSTLDRVSRQLARRGFLSMTVVRLLPLAPFTLINLAAGASHIRFPDFVLGTVLGMAPGIIAITLFSGQLGQVLRSPDLFNFGLLTVLLMSIVGAGWWSWRRFAR